MNETKGYFSLKGKIWNLSNKEAKDFGVKRFLSFGIQTDKDNSLFVQVGEWKNTKLNIKLKAEGETEVTSLNEQEAIDRIRTSFKDGDSVFVNMRVEVDTYNKRLNYLVNALYIENEPIDFNSADFKELNELNTSAIITEKPSNRKVNVGLVTYKGDMLELELSLSDNDVNDYFEEKMKVGDLAKVTISVNRKPNYVEGEVTDAEPTRKTLKGKSAGGGSGKRVIDKDNPYTESLEIIDVDLDKTEKSKYTKEEVRVALEDSISKKETPATKEDIMPIDDGDLPF